MSGVRLGLTAGAEFEGVPTVRLVGQWCLAESIVHVRCVSDSSGAR